MQYFKTLYMYDLHPKISLTVSKYVHYFHTTKIYKKMANLASGTSLILGFYYIDTSVLLENILLVKFIKTTSGTRVVYFP